MVSLGHCTSEKIGLGELGPVALMHDSAVPVHAN
jgi:hypothetical protein